METLFDLEPYSQSQRERQPKLSKDVVEALARLKTAMTRHPFEEKERRRRALRAAQPYGFSR